MAVIIDVTTEVRVSKDSVERLNVFNCNRQRPIRLFADTNADEQGVTVGECIGHENFFQRIRDFVVTPMQNQLIASKESRFRRSPRAPEES